MDWVNYSDHRGFELQHPAGWMVVATDFPSCVVHSPDRLQFAVIQPLMVNPSLSGVDVISKGQFYTATWFPGAVPAGVTAPSTTAAQGVLQFQSADRSPGKATLFYSSTGSSAMLYAVAAPAAIYPQVEPTLLQIIQRHQALTQQRQQQQQQLQMQYPPPASRPKSPPINWESLIRDDSVPAPKPLPLKMENYHPSNRSIPPAGGSNLPTPPAAPAPKASPMIPHPLPTSPTTGGPNLASMFSVPPGPTAVPPAHPAAVPMVALNTAKINIAAAASMMGAILPSIVPTASPAPASLPAAIRYIPFTDPQRGSFTIEVPAGWSASGGLAHPGLGDRRIWYELNSPDGIYILCDPTFPQSMCCSWMGPNGKVIPVAAGGHFLCLKPGAESSADAYLAQAGARRLPGFARIHRKPRPDVVVWLAPKLAKVGLKIGRKGHIAGVETILQRNTPAGAIIASLLTISIFNGDYGPGIGFWDSHNMLAISPQALAGTAEAVRTRAAETLQYTNAMTQIVQQDEAQIYNNAQMQNAAQWNWFNGQQQAHNAQLAMGDAIVNNYWAQQQANDSMLRGWEHNQAVYDRLSQDRSDAMLDRQRLADDAGGHNYEAPAGSNYYWRDERTGNVIGTATDQPPDLLNYFTPLRKL